MLGFPTKILPMMGFLTCNNSNIFQGLKLVSIGGICIEPFSRLHRANKGIPPTCPDEDPKLQLGSRPPVKRIPVLVTQQDTPISGGISTDTTNTSGTSPDGDEHAGALFLTVD